MDVKKDRVRTSIYPMYATDNISCRIPNPSWKLHRSLHNDYLYKEKNRPQPICLPLHRYEHPIRIQQVEFAEDFDINDIERLDDSSPMLIIQKYNGFRQGTRDRRFNKCSRSEEENCSKQETTYKYSNIGTTTGYASDEENETKEPSETFKTCAEKNQVNSTWFWSEIPHTCLCQRLTGHISLDWKCRREKKEKSCTLSIDSSGRTKYPGINIESEICLQRELQTSQHSDRSESALLRSGNVDLSTECKANNVKSFINCPSNIGNLASLSLNQADSEDVNPLELAVNDKNKCKKSFSTVKNENSGKTVDNFYTTILPLELDNNQMITKINPLIFYEDSGNEDDDILSSFSDNSLNTDEQRSNSKVDGGEEFIYSLEEFPHPPDHFFASDTASLTSVSIVPNINSVDISDNLQLNDFSDTAEKFNPFFIHSKHFTFQVDQTIMGRHESVSSSNDGSSDFLRQCSRESDLVSTSASGECPFNPSSFVTTSKSLFDSRSKESISTKTANTQQWIIKSFNSVDIPDSRIKRADSYDGIISCTSSIRNKLISDLASLQDKNIQVQRENPSREINKKSPNNIEMTKQNARNETVDSYQFNNENKQSQFRNKFKETLPHYSEGLHITVPKLNQSVDCEKTSIDDSVLHIDYSESGSAKSECFEECVPELINIRLAAVKDMLQRASTMSKEDGCKRPRN